MVKDLKEGKDMKISFFKSAYDNAAKPRDLDWKELVDLFSEHEIIGSDEDNEGNAKLSCTAFSPAVFKEDKRRKDAVISISLGVLDVDSGNEDNFNSIMKKLSGMSYIVYSSWSHSKALSLDGKWKYRVVVPLSRPVKASEYPKFWQLFNEYFNSLGDTSCKDPAKMYFTPSAPTSKDKFVFTGEGTSFNVDSILNKPEIQEKKEGKTTVTKKDLQSLSYSLIRKKNEHFKEMAKMINLGIDGFSMAPEGTRNESYFKLTSVLADKFPYENPENLTRLFEKGLSKLEKDPAWAIQCFTDLLVRHQEPIRKELDKKQEGFRVDQDVFIRAAFGFAGRAHPYTKEELEGFYDSLDLTASEFKTKWILQSGMSYYIFFNGQYNKAPKSEKELSNKAKELLAPACSAGVSCWKVSKTGDIVLKKPVELMAEYGSCVDEVSYSYIEKTTKLDLVNSKLVIPVGATRKLKAERNEQIETWLGHLFGDNIDKVNDWLASLTKQDKPCAALYMQGPGRVGKSLFISGINRMWSTEDAIKLSDVMDSNFNFSLTKSPLSIVEEGMPSTYNKTAAFRDFIQSRARGIRQLYKDFIPLEGCVRVVLAANNDRLLYTSEEMTEEDIAAIVDRVFHVEVSNDAGKYLATLSEEVIDSWVQGDKIAKHVQWLIENHQVMSKERFIVSGAETKLHKRWRLGLGLASDVCHWLVQYLLKPNKVDNTSDAYNLIRINKERLLVTSEAISSYWDIYSTNERAPKLKVVSGVLKRISKVGKRICVRTGKGNVNFWDIDIENLKMWAQDEHHIDVELLSEALKIETKPASIGLKRKLGDSNGKDKDPR